jgi:enoyl-CoA hydratase/carnithine racemase
LNMCGNVKLKLDTQASVRHHVGFLRLNREHRHNMLTPNYIKNIRRNLETLNLDQIVKVIYMTGGKGE